jgi:hypothetical protein
LHEIEILPCSVSPVFDSVFSSGNFDEDSAHGFGGGREEMAAVIPVHVSSSGGRDESHISFVDECRGLQRLPGLFMRQLVGGEPTELIIDQGQKLIRRMRVTVLEGRQEL